MKNLQRVPGFFLVLLLILCAGCSSGGGGKQVSESIITKELGVLAEKADKVTYRHNYDKDTKIDVVTVSLTYENEFCKSTVTSDFSYQYYKSDDLWELLNRTNWAQDAQLKDFSKKLTQIEKYARDYGYEPLESHPRYYFLLDFEPGSLDTKNNTVVCEYYVEASRYDQKKGVWNTFESFLSNGYTHVKVNIDYDASVYLTLVKPGSSKDRVFYWFTPTDVVVDKAFLNVG